MNLISLKNQLIISCQILSEKLLYHSYTAKHVTVFVSGMSFVPLFFF